MKDQNKFKIDGKTFEANAGDAIHIPANTPHSARGVGHVEALRAVQVYAGPGPEQRFTQGKKTQPEG